MKAGAFTIAALMVLLAVTQTDAQTRAVSLDSVSGLNWKGEIAIDAPVTFYIKFSNPCAPSCDSLRSVLNGFRVYSPDGAQWQPLTHVPYELSLNHWISYHSEWSDYFGIIIVDESGVTGSGADSLQFLCMAVFIGDDGLPAGFSDVVYTISTQVNADQAGKTLCLDSASCPPDASWKWETFDQQWITPTWDGPHCFTIEDNTDTLDFIIALDSVDGLVEGTSDELKPGVPVTFYLKFTNPSAKNRYIWSVRNAFCVHSPDGATWEPLEHLPWYNSGTSSWEVYYPGWNVYPYFDANLFANDLHITGSGADTIDFGGVATLLGEQEDGLEPGFSENVYTITTQFDAGQSGKTICLDKAEQFYLPWQWMTHTAGAVSPVWEGPYCFTVGAPPDFDDDGVPDMVDNCLTTPNPDQSDSDLDGKGNLCDNCPLDYNPLQLDFNGDGIGDACCCTGIRGNANSDLEDKCNITDITYLVKYLFGIPTGPPPGCPAEGNANSDLDEKSNIADITYLVAYLFGIPPGPPPQDCP